MKQKLLQKYCEQVRKEKLVKEVEIPVLKLYEEASGYSLQKKEPFWILWIFTNDCIENI